MGSQKIWIEMLALPQVHGLTLGKLFNFSILILVDMIGRVEQAKNYCLCSLFDSEFFEAVLVSFCI